MLIGIILFQVFLSVEGYMTHDECDG